MYFYYKKKYFVGKSIPIFGWGRIKSLACTTCLFCCETATSESNLSDAMVRSHRFFVVVYMKDCSIRLKSTVTPKITGACNSGVLGDAPQLVQCSQECQQLFVRITCNSMHVCMYSLCMYVFSFLYAMNLLRCLLVWHFYGRLNGTTLIVKPKKHSYNQSTL